jgi:hypothetical protein
MADDILDEIRDLLDKAKTATSKKSTVSNSDVKGLAEALSKAASSSELKRLNQVYKDQIKTSQLDKKAKEEAVRVLDELTNEQEKAIKASKELNEKLYQLAKGTGLNVVQSQRLADQAVEAKEAMGALGKAMSAGSGKIDDYTAAFKGKFGGFGDIIVGIGSTFEDNINTYRTLSSVGASFGQDLVKLRETAAAAGLPIEDFTKLIAKNSQSLAALYGSTTLGAQSFSRLSREFRQGTTDSLIPLGFSVDELNDVLLTNLNMQRRTGQFVEGADRQQLESSRAFALELDRMSKLTGIQRSELAKQIESQTKNERFLAFLNTTTDETRQRLQTFAGSVEGISPALAEGLQDLMANAGNPVTQASKMLVMNIPEATSVVRELTNGTISSSEALLRMRDAAQRSNQSLGAVAQTGTVEFARLYGDVNKLAKAKLNETAVTQEQSKRASLLTQQLAEFQGASKEVAASFQSLETGFFAAMGDVIGGGIGGINFGLKGLAAGVNNLNNASKALLYAGTKIGGFVLDKATQVGVVFTGTLGALKAAGMGTGGVMGNIGNMYGAGKGMVGDAAKTTKGQNLIKGGKFGAGGLGLGMASSLIKSNVGDNIVSQGLDVGSYALMGASIGSIIPGLGTGLGAAIGAGLGLINQMGGFSGIAGSRASGTLGETGRPFEAKTSMLKVHAGERVLNPQETSEYNKAAPDAGQTQHMMEYNQTAKQLLEATKATNALLNKQVAIAMATEKNTKKTSKVVDKVGPSIV